MKKTTLIAILMAMLPTMLWAGSVTYYARLTVGTTSNSPTGSGLVYASTSATEDASQYGNKPSIDANSGSIDDSNKSADVGPFYVYARENDGFQFDGWFENQSGTGTAKSTEKKYTYGKINTSKSDSASPETKYLYAKFSKKTLSEFSITFQTTSAGAYTVDGAAPANKTGLTEATSVVLKSTDANFLNWVVNGTVVNDNPYTVTCLSDTTISADFLTADQVTSVTTISELTSALSNAAYKKIIIPSGTSIAVAKGSTITVPSGKQLVVDGTLNVLGTLSNSGTISGNGTLYKVSQLITQGDVKTLYNVKGEPLGNVALRSNTGKPAKYRTTTVTANSPTISGTVSCTTSWGAMLNGGNVYAITAQNPKALKVTLKTTECVNEITAITGTITGDIAEAASYNYVLLDNCNLKGPTVIETSSSSTYTRLSYQGTIDCAGKKLTSKAYQFSSNFTGIFLNGSIDMGSTTYYIQGPHMAFFGCTSVSLAGNKNAANTFYFYDCGTASSAATITFGYYNNTRNTNNRTAYFYCGYYNYTFNTTDDTGRCHVYGGSFTKDPTAYLEGNDLEAPREGNYYVVQKYIPPVYVAQIGSTQYLTLQAAVDAAATSGGTVELLLSLQEAGLDTPVTIAAGKTVTIDLNGMVVSAPNGAIVNNGTLYLQDTSTKTIPGTLSTESGNVIVNNGTLDVTYGKYDGNILLNSGTFTTHAGLFTGSLLSPDGIDIKTVADIRGGRFVSDPTAALREGYRAPYWHYSTEPIYYWAGQIPAPLISSTSYSGMEKAWKLDLLSTADATLYAKGTERSAHSSDADWRRRADIYSSIYPYHNYIFDCALIFDRDVEQDSVTFAGKTQIGITESLDRDLPANTYYPVLARKIAASGSTAYTYDRTITEIKSVTAGLKNNSADNYGTVCAIEIQICKASGNVVGEFDKLYALAQVRYMLGGKKAAIDRGASRLAYDSLAAAVSAVQDGERVLVGADTAENVTLPNAAGEYIIDPYGFAFTGTVTAPEGLTVTSEEVASLAAAQGVESATAVKYTVIVPPTIATVDGAELKSWDAVVAAVNASGGSSVAVVVTAPLTESLTLAAGKTLTVSVADGVAATVTVTPAEGAFLETSAADGMTTYTAKQITVKMAEPAAASAVEVTKIANGEESEVTGAEAEAAVATLVGNGDVPRTDNTDKLDVLDKITVTPTKIVLDENGKIKSAMFDVTPALNAGQSLAEGQTLKFRLPVDPAATQLSSIVYHNGEQFGIYAVQTYNAEKFIEVASADFSPYGYELLDGETENPIAAIGTTGYATLPDAIAAASNGDTITVFAGTFDIGSDTIVVNKQVTITGAGKDTTTLNSTATGKAAFSIQASNVTIENMTINQSDKTASNTTHIQIGSKSAVVENVTVQDVKFTGSKYSLAVYARNLTVDSCDFVEPGSDAILLYTVQGTSAISDNTFIQTSPNGQGFIYGTTSDGTDPLSSGSLTISGNTASGGRCFYHCNNQNRIDTTAKLTLTITGNEVIGYNNKAIVFAGHSDIPLGNIFNSIIITENALYTTAKRPTIQRDDADTSSLAINASGNYWGAATPDFENLIPGTSDKYLILPHENSNIIVDSYYQAYDEVTDTLSNLYEIPRVAQNMTTGVKYESLAAAVADATAGDTIELIADTTITAQQTVSGLTIDLNGKNITTDSSVMAFRFEGNSALTDSAGTGSLNTRCIDNYGSLVIDGVTYNENGSGGASAIRNFGSSLAISNSMLTVNSQFGVTSRPGADDVTIYNSTIQPTAAQHGFVAINSESRTDTIIEDSTINAWFGYRAYRQGSDASPTATAEDSTVVVKGSTVNIDNSLTGDANGSAAFAAFVDDVTITIQDTAITVTTHDVENAAGSYAFGSHNFSSGNACGGLTLTIDEDSSITLSGTHSSLLTTQPSEPDILSGENVDFEVEGNALRSQFEGAGYAMLGVPNKEGWYTVNAAVAKIGDELYATFADAIAAADAAVAGGDPDPVIIALDPTAAQDNADWTFVTDSSVDSAVTTLVRRTYYNVWVGGTRIAADNAADVFGDGKVSYDAATKTLTLNGYTYSGVGYQNSAIYAADDIAVVVKGENALTSTTGNCIYAGGTISVTGDGATPTLNIAAKSDSYAMQVAGGSAAFTNVTMAVSGNRGIVVNENNDPSDSIDIKGCNITFANGTDRALQVWNGEGDSLLTIADSTVTGVGRIVMFAEGATGDTTCFITNSTVALTDSQIESYNGDATVEISESTVSMTGGANNKNGAFNVGARYGAGKTASVKILNNSDVTCSGQYSGINVWTWGENGSQASEIIVEDSTLTASGAYYGMSAYSIYEGDTSVYFENSTVNLTGAISAVEMCSDASYNAVGDKTYTQIDSDVTLTTTQYPYGLDLDNSTSDGVNGDASNTATITGGSLTCNGCGLYVVGDDDNNSGITMHDANVTIDVTGRAWYPIVTGELSVDSGSYTIIDPDENGIAVDVGNISGGNFNIPVPEELCADGYIPTPRDPVTGMYTVKQGTFVAAVYDDSFDLVGKYETLYDAVRAAQDGYTVELLADVEESVTIGKSVALTGEYTITGVTKVNAGATVAISDLALDGDGNIYALDIAGGATVEVENVTIGGGQWCNVHLNGGALNGSGVTMLGDDVVVAADGQSCTYRGETLTEAPWGMDLSKMAGKTLKFPFMDIVRESGTDVVELDDTQDNPLVQAGSILYVANMPGDTALTDVTLPERFGSYTLTIDADIGFLGNADTPTTGWTVGDWNGVIDTGSTVLDAIGEDSGDVQVELTLNGDTDLGEDVFEFRYPNLTIDGDGNAVSGTIKYTDDAGAIENIVLGTDEKPLTLDMTGVTDTIHLGNGVNVANVVVQLTAEQATAGTPVFTWTVGEGTAPEHEDVVIQVSGGASGSELVWDDELGVAYIGPAEVRLTGPTHEKPIYTSIAAAIALAAQSGDTITLLTDIEDFTGSHDIGKSLTIDGAGHKVVAGENAGGEEMFNVAGNGVVTFRDITLDGAHKYTYCLQVYGLAQLVLDDVTVLHGTKAWLGDFTYGAGVHVNGGTLSVTNSFTAFSGGKTDESFPFTGILYDGGSIRFSGGATASIANPEDAEDSDLLLVGMLGAMDVSDPDTRAEVQAMLDYMNVPAGFYPYTLKIAPDQWSSGLEENTSFTGASPLGWNDIIDYGKAIMEAISMDTAETPVEVGLLEDTILPDTFVFEDSNFTVNGNGNALSGTIEYTNDAGILENIVLGTEEDPLVLDMTGLGENAIHFGSDITATSVIIKVTEAQATLMGHAIVTWDAAHETEEEAESLETGIVVEIVDDNGDPILDPETNKPKEASVIWDLDLGLAYIGPCEARLTGPTHEKPIYTSLADAIARAANSGDTVTLLIDIENFTGTQNIAKTLTLDGAGHTIAAAPVSEHRDIVNAWAGSTSMFKLWAGDIAIQNLTLDGDATHAYTYLVSADNGNVSLTTENVALLNGGELAGDGSGAAVAPGAGYGAAIHLNNGASLTVKDGFYADTHGGPAAEGETIDRADGVFPFTAILVDEGGALVEFDLEDDSNDNPTVGIGEDLLLVGMPIAIAPDDVQGLLDYMQVPSRFIPYTLTLGDGSAYAFTGASPLGWNDIIDYGKEIMDVSTALGFDGLDKDETPVEVGLLTDTVLPGTFVFEDGNFTINGNGNALSGTIEYTDDAGGIHNITLGTQEEPLVLDMTGVTEPITFGDSVAIGDVAILLTGEQAAEGTRIVVWDAAEGPPENEPGASIVIVDAQGRPTGDTATLVWDDERGVAYIEITGYIVDADGEAFAILPKASVPAEWIAANVVPEGDEPTHAEIEAELNTLDETVGIPKWEAFVLGLIGPFRITNATDAARSVVTTSLGTQPVGTGIDVTYSLDRVTVAGGTVLAGAAVGEPSFVLDMAALRSDTAFTNAYYKVTAHLASGENTTRVVSTNALGVLKVSSGAEQAIVAVPWASLADGGDISVARFVRTDTLAEDDELYAYDKAAGKFYAWTLGADGRWSPMPTVAGADIVSGGDASGYTLARGIGVWLKRAAPSAPVLLVGEASAAAAVTALAPSAAVGTDDKQGWNLVGPPVAEAFDLDAIVPAGSFDRIVVPSDEPGAAPRNYTYENGAWGRSVLEPVLRNGQQVGVRPVRSTGDTLLPAGIGFWYLNSAGATDLPWPAAGE